jgi:hypothetical protein
MSELKIVLHQHELEFYLDPEEHTGWESYYLRFSDLKEKQELREWTERCCKDTVIIWSGGTVLTSTQIHVIGRNRTMNETLEKSLSMTSGGEFGWQIYFRSAQDAAMFKLTFLNSGSFFVR